MNNLFQRIQDEPGMRRPADAPPDDTAGESVDNESHINKTPPCGHVGEIADPEHVRRRRLELAVHLVQRTGLILVRDGRPVLPAANDAFQPHVRHKSGYGTAGHIEAFSLNLAPDLTNTVDLVVLIPDACDLWPQRHVALIAF